MGRLMMQVTRVEESTSSHIEPPLNSRWPALKRLEWKAAVVTEDAGNQVSVTVVPADYAEQILGIWIPKHGYFSVQIASPRGAQTTGPMTYVEAWALLNGIAIGIRELNVTFPLTQSEKP